MTPAATSDVTLDQVIAVLEDLKDEFRAFRADLKLLCNHRINKHEDDG